MSGVFDLTNVLQFIIDRFYDGPFPEQYFIGYGHQAVFHVVPYVGYEMDTVHEKHLGKFLAHIALVGVQLAEYPVQETLLFQRRPVIFAGLGYSEIEYLALVVYDDVELKTVEPSHRGLPGIGNAFENLVSANALILADPYRCRVHEGYTCALAKATGLEEDGHRHQVLLHQLGKPIVGNRPGKLPPHMSLYIKEIEVLESPEPAQVEENCYGDDLAP